MQYRYSKDILLRGGDDALSGKWCESTVGRAKTGEQLSHNSCIPHHRLRADNVAQAAQAGRGRGKRANAKNNGRKTTGSHLAHNFGPGRQYLAAFLLSLNLLALLCQTVLEGSEDK